MDIENIAVEKAILDEIRPLHRADCKCSYCKRAADADRALAAAQEAAKEREALKKEIQKDKEDIRKALNDAQVIELFKEKKERTARAEAFMDRMEFLKELNVNFCKNNTEPPVLLHEDCEIAQIDIRVDRNTEEISACDASLSRKLSGVNPNEQVAPPCIETAADYEKEVAAYCEEMTDCWMADLRHLAGINPEEKLTKVLRKECNPFDELKTNIINKLRDRFTTLNIEWSEDHYNRHLSINGAKTSINLESLAAAFDGLLQITDRSGATESITNVIIEKISKIFI